MEAIGHRRDPLCRNERVDLACGAERCLCQGRAAGDDGAFAVGKCLADAQTPSLVHRWVYGEASVLVEGRQMLVVAIRDVRDAAPHQWIVPHRAEQIRNS